MNAMNEQPMNNQQKTVNDYYKFSALLIVEYCSVKMVLVALAKHPPTQTHAHTCRYSKCVHATANTHAYVIGWRRRKSRH